MLNKDEIKSRLEMIASSNDISKKWAAVNEELIKGTYPSLKIRERKVLRCTIETIWDMQFSNARYDEVVFRLKHKDKKLFPSKKIIDKSIGELCEMGILKNHISEFVTRDRFSTTRTQARVLDLPDTFREEAIKGMADVFKTAMDSHLLPEKKG